MDRHDKIKLVADEELFVKWKRFEKEHGFGICSFSGLVQNDMEDTLENVFFHVQKMRKRIQEKIDDIATEFDDLLTQTNEFIVKNNPKLKE